MNFNFSSYKIQEITNGKWLNRVKDEPLNFLSIDSRQPLINSQQTLFIALKGVNYDSHQFLLYAYEKGVRNFLVSEEIDFSQFVGANIVKVQDSLVALREIAKYHKHQFITPTIGITGSYGKTIVKEWLYQVLSSTYRIARSPKSFNSQVGLPLSLFQINKDTELGIFEAGISEPGEMIFLEKVLEPKYGVFTNIGEAHQGAFESCSQKIEEKSKLFIHSEWVVSPNEEEIVTAIKKVCPNTEIVTFGKDKSSSFQIHEEQNGAKNFLRIKGRSRFISFEIKESDRLSIQNYCSVICVCLQLNIPEEIIQRGLLNLTAVSMRMEKLEGVNNNTLISDVYGSELISLAQVLRFAQQQKEGNKTLIISEFENKHDSFEEFSKLISQFQVNKIYAIGNFSRFKKIEIKGVSSSLYPSTASFLKDLNGGLSFQNETIVIKGSRKFKFEKIVNRLKYQNHETQLQLNLFSVAHNIKYFRSLLPKNTQIMSIIKASAYGNGALEIAHLMQQNGVNYLGVAYTDEGYELRKQGVSLPIMVINPSKEDLSTLIRYKLEPEIYSISQLLKYVGELSDSQELKVHVKLNTGMNRLGLEQEELDQLVEILRLNPNVKIQSVLSHLVGADNPMLDSFTREQIQKFQIFTNSLEEKVGYTFIRQILNSAGVQRFPNEGMDMVRIGIGLYGIGVDDKQQQYLMPAHQLLSQVTQIRTIKSGDSVGYNRAFLSNKERKIATVPIGYADGVPRSLSNGKGKFWINGSFAPIVGNVCMDMTMIDVTNIAVKEGDQVEIFGPNLSIHEVSEDAGTIPYEILTRISSRVQKVFFRE